MSPDPFQEIKVLRELLPGGKHGAGDGVGRGVEADGGPCGWEVGDI